MTLRKIRKENMKNKIKIIKRKWKSISIKIRNEIENEIENENE